ncbi:MAG: glutaredoxin 3 [Candidatus Eremiobacteraeota bacterium]|jgi:glutaredoxin 3|nr:glutaredoxin 3 [Candidatus Eremiobacteraeota bacterium]
MDLERLEPGHRVEMYVSPTCPYCQQARAHFDARGYPYTAYDAQNDRALRERMFAYTGGDPTVPALVVDGAYVQSGWGSPPRG